jgi:SAM-dependent methyltransferase
MSGLSETIKTIVPDNVLPVMKKTMYTLRSIYFAGKHYTCPFCNGHFRQMLPFGLKLPVLEENHVIGGGYRANCLCPKCNSSDRERLVYLYLIFHTILLLSEISVLHIAPEVNLAKIFSKEERFYYLSGDLDSPLAMMKMDITQIPLQANMFNLVICNHVLEHIPADRKAMCEIFRVLKPGGVAILQVPVSRILNNSVENLSSDSESARLNHFGQKDHVRIYSASDYINRLEQTGFIVEEFDWTQHKEFDPVRNKYSLNYEERLFIARKPNV